MVGDEEDERVLSDRGENGGKEAAEILVVGLE